MSPEAGCGFGCGCWGFLFLSAASTLHLLPNLTLRFDSQSWFSGWQTQLDLRQGATLASRACLAASLAAIGLQTRWVSPKQVGATALVAALAANRIITSVMGWLVFEP